MYMRATKSVLQAVAPIVNIALQACTTHKHRKETFFLETQAIPRGRALGCKLVSILLKLYRSREIADPHSEWFGIFDV